MAEENKQAAGAQEATNVAEAAKAETVKEAPATLRFVIGEKVGMTQLFDEKGNLHGVSVVKAGPCKVVRVRTQEKDGYNAVCIGFGEVKESKLNKPELGYFKKANTTPVRHLKEHRVADVNGFEIGQVISLEKIFKPGDYVDVQGSIKGHGFAGAMKRHGFAGQASPPATVPLKEHPVVWLPAALWVKYCPASAWRGITAPRRTPSPKLKLSKWTTKTTCCSSKAPSPAPRAALCPSWKLPKTENT